MAEHILKVWPRYFYRGHAMSQPTQTCELCGNVEVVTPDGRGFPPDIAKRKLKKRCAANGCPSKPKYLPGFVIGGKVFGCDLADHVIFSLLPAGLADKDTQGD